MYATTATTLAMVAGPPSHTLACMQVLGIYEGNVWLAALNTEQVDDDGDKVVCIQAEPHN